MKPQLYVTDWAPNGTNDLLVYRDGEIIGWLEEATFGLDVDGHGYIDTVEGLMWVRLVDVETVSRKLAISPVRSLEDAQNRVLAFLNKHGVI